VYELYDFSDEARFFVQSIQMMRENVTLNYLCELYRGCPSKRIKDQAVARGHTNLPMYGRGERMSADDAARLGRQLLVLRVLDEELCGNM
jgi:superfamily II DNA helicase RecQ